MKKLRIWRLKRRLRATYLDYLDELNRYDCGVDVAMTINPRIRLLRDECNRLLDRLVDLDPYNCPITRFS